MAQLPPGVAAGATPKVVRQPAAASVSTPKSKAAERKKTPFPGARQSATSTPRAPLAAAKSSASPVRTPGSVAGSAVSPKAVGGRVALRGERAKRLRGPEPYSEDMLNSFLGTSGSIEEFEEWMQALEEYPVSYFVVLLVLLRCSCRRRVSLACPVVRQGIRVLRVRRRKRCAHAAAKKRFNAPIPVGSMPSSVPGTRGEHRRRCGRCL